MKVLPTEKEMLFIFHGKIKPGIYVAEIAKTTAFGIQNRETSKAQGNFNDLFKENEKYTIIIPEIK